MSRLRSSLALLLAVTLLLPGAVHVGTGACLAGQHHMAAGMAVQVPPPPAPMHGSPCEGHHGSMPGQGGAQHCSVPASCGAGPAVAAGFPVVDLGEIQIARLIAVPDHPLTSSISPATPPPRR